MKAGAETTLERREEKVRKTKLVITVGPALLAGGPLRECLALADVIRINAGHSPMDERTRTLALIRETARELGREIPVLLDLQGPKWRIGVMEANQELADGAIGALYAPEKPAPEGYPWTAPLPHPELFKGAKTGQIWFMDDGALKLEVVQVFPGLIESRVLTGGVLKSRKGVLPIGLDIAFDPITPKDIDDIRWGVSQDVDLFAQSFVRRAEDIRALEDRIRELGGHQTIIAKIEHPKALENLDEILEVAWGVMVARGDLGVECGVERVPALQKHIIRKAKMALKPVITATQMLESMIENPQPTRAEASDVANAIWDGTDAVMLSAESAVGRHPLEAVRWLARIAEDADNHYRPRLGRFADCLNEKLTANTDVSLAFAACRTAEDIAAKLIVVFTEGGGSARMVSRLAANTPVLGVTSDLHNARRLGLLRGVDALRVSRTDSSDVMVDRVERQLLKREDLRPGDRVVITMGLPLWRTGTTNTMKVVTLKE